MQKNFKKKPYQTYFFTKLTVMKFKLNVRAKTAIYIHITRNEFLNELKEEYKMYFMWKAERK